jgi:hypothetical protein
LKGNLGELARQRRAVGLRRTMVRLAPAPRARPSVVRFGASAAMRFADTFGIPLAHDLLFYRLENLLGLENK